MNNDGQIWHGELTDYWLEDEVLFGSSKQTSCTIEKLRTDFNLVKKITNNKRTCFILDNTYTKGYDIVTLKYSLSEIPQTFNAIAFVSRSSNGKMVSEIFAQLYSAESLTVQIFDQVIPAKEWILQYKKAFRYSAVN
jgi:hypothetical protein